VVPAEPPIHLAAQVRTLLGRDLELSLEIVRAAVFHGFAVSLHVELEATPEPAELRATLGESPFVDLSLDPQELGPIDAASRDEVIVGPVRRDPRRAGVYWIWAVMDNLTCGGAANAIAILEAVGTQVTQ